jgi:hypothetical protein
LSFDLAGVQRFGHRLFLSGASRSQLSEATTSFDPSSHSLSKTSCCTPSTQPAQHHAPKGGSRAFHPPPGVLLDGRKQQNTQAKHRLVLDDSA